MSFPNIGGSGGPSGSSDFRRATSGLGNYTRPVSGQGGQAGGSGGGSNERFSVAIVNDSSMALVMLRRVLEPTGKFSIVWTAANGRDAVESCLAVRPDLILMDLVMPVMDGIEATRQIMQQCPCSILIVTSSVDSRSEAVFQAMDAGALDVVRTPRLDDEAGRNAFLLKVETLAWLVDRQSPSPSSSPSATASAFGGSSPMTGITGSGLTPVKPKGTLLSQLRKPTGPVRPPGVALPAQPPPLPGSPRDRVATRLVIVGCSAGGPAALSIILKRLPKDLSAAVIIVQHITQEFSGGLAEWLQRYSHMPIGIAKETSVMRSAMIWVAGSDDHLVLTSPTSLGYTPEPRSNPYRPSVDTFMDSAARYWKGEILGVLLTGMGRDGAAGLKGLRALGYPTIAQDRATCAVYGMPKAAAEMGAAAEILPLVEIPQRIAAFAHHPSASGSPSSSSSSSSSTSFNPNRNF